MNQNVMKKVTCFLLLLMMLSGISGTAYPSEVTWHIVSDPAAAETEHAGFLVSEYTGTVSVTFLGDCCLGGEEGFASNRRGFLKTVEREGYSYPLAGLLPLTASDDFTVANLEGVLTDRELPRVEKTYNFKGPADYTGILRYGSIECVTLANNHARDYGEAGYADTKQALSAAGIAYFGTDCVAYCEIHGLRIGFSGSAGSASGNNGKRLAAQMDTLKQLGCQAIIHVMHAGTEYTYERNSYQNQIAELAIASGADAVVGHHPHVLQGLSEIGGIPVAWSLGNCCFGGTTHAKDNDALVLRLELHFEESELTGVTCRFYPISITSGNGGNNNYAPVLLSGSEAERVIAKMRRVSDAELSPWTEEEGAWARFPVP